ncbi:hypothetical protein V8E52_006666 [Russula decolorans]
MMCAFSRDGAIPASNFLRNVDHRWRSPIRTVRFSSMLSFILGLPSLCSSVVFSSSAAMPTHYRALFVQRLQRGRDGASVLRSQWRCQRNRSSRRRARVLKRALGTFIVQGQKGRCTTRWREWDSEREQEGVR